MRRVRWMPLLAILAACDSPVGLDVDMDQFDAIPALEALSIANLQPASNWDYWELRRVMPGGPMPDRVVGSGGPLSRAQLPPAATAELDVLAPQSGFAIGCLPGYCFSFIAAVRDDEVTTFLDLDALRSFIGVVDTMEEAALLVHAMGYQWDMDHEATGVRALSDGGWEFIVTMLVRDCAPIQYDRVLLRVDRPGTVSVRGREVWQRHEGACI